MPGMLSGKVLLRRFSVSCASRLASRVACRQGERPRVGVGDESFATHYLRARQHHELGGRPACLGALGLGDFFPGCFPPLVRGDLHHRRELGRGLDVGR
eukprot:scaffold61047_cov38-Phaeocystis_antarctica.AAC.2